MVKIPSPPLKRLVAHTTACTISKILPAPHVYKLRTHVNAKVDHRFKYNSTNNTPHLISLMIIVISFIDESAVSFKILTMDIILAAKSYIKVT